VAEATEGHGPFASQSFFAPSAALRGEQNRKATSHRGAENTENKRNSFSVASASLLRLTRKLLIPLWSVIGLGTGTRLYAV
jgi:hypothetical protein